MVVITYPLLSISLTMLAQGAHLSEFSNILSLISSQKFRRELSQFKIAFNDINTCPIISKYMHITLCWKDVLLKHVLKEMFFCADVTDVIIVMYEFSFANIFLTYVILPKRIYQLFAHYSPHDYHDNVNLTLADILETINMLLGIWCFECIIMNYKIYSVIFHSQQWIGYAWY